MGIKRVAPPPSGGDLLPPNSKSARIEHELRREHELLREATWNMECLLICLQDENSNNKDLFCIEYGTQNELEEASKVQSAESRNFVRGNAFLECLIFNNFTKADFDTHKIFMAASNLLGRVLVHEHTDLHSIATACFQICFKFHMTNSFPFAAMANYCGCNAETLLRSEQKTLNIVGFDIARCTTIDILHCICKFHREEKRLLALQVIDSAEWLTVVIQRDCASKYMDCAKTMAVGALLSALHDEFNAHIDDVFEIPDDISKRLITKDAEEASKEINFLVKKHPTEFERWPLRARGCKDTHETYAPENVVLNPDAIFKYTSGKSKDPFCTP